MAFWSAENATNAYLRTLKMGKRGNQEADIDIAEFISALAAGNNAQLMVVACDGAVECSMVLALVAAAHQTGGRVVCVVRGPDQIIQSENGMGPYYSSHVEFVVGEAENVLTRGYEEADFVLVDCNMESHENVIKTMQRKGRGGIVVGYNALCNGSRQCRSNGLEGELLPIGGGLLVTRISKGGCGKSRWIAKIDRFTGEEHVFRVRTARGK